MPRKKKVDQSSSSSKLSIANGSTSSSTSEEDLSSASSSVVDPRMFSNIDASKMTKSTKDRMVQLFMRQLSNSDCEMEGKQNSSSVMSNNNNINNSKNNNSGCVSGGGKTVNWDKVKYPIPYRVHQRKTISSPDNQDDNDNGRGVPIETNVKSSDDNDNDDDDADGDEENSDSGKSSGQTKKRRKHRHRRSKRKHSSSKKRSSKHHHSQNRKKKPSSAGSRDSYDDRLDDEDDDYFEDIEDDERLDDRDEDEQPIDEPDDTDDFETARTNSRHCPNVKEELTERLKRHRDNNKHSNRSHSQKRSKKKKKKRKKKSKNKKKHSHSKNHRDQNKKEKKLNKSSNSKSTSTTTTSDSSSQTPDSFRSCKSFKSTEKAGATSESATVAIDQTTKAGLDHVKQSIEKLDKQMVEMSQLIGKFQLSLNCIQSRLKETIVCEEQKIEPNKSRLSLKCIPTTTAEIKTPENKCSASANSSSTDIPTRKPSFDYGSFVTVVVPTRKVEINENNTSSGTASFPIISVPTPDVKGQVSSGTKVVNSKQESRESVVGESSTITTLIANHHNSSCSSVNVVPSSEAASAATPVPAASSSITQSVSQTASIRSDPDLIQKQQSRLTTKSPTSKLFGMLPPEIPRDKVLSDNSKPAPSPQTESVSRFQSITNSALKTTSDSSNSK